MPRGKRDVNRTRRILQKVLDGVPYKQIVFEENTHIPNICALKAKYIDETIILKLNKLGQFLMNEEQLSLPLHRNNIHRVVTRLSNPRDWRIARRRPRKLV